YALQSNFLLAIGLVAGGVTMQWWRPILTYPFQAALHAVLLQRAEAGNPWPLSFHPALWDELQFLPFYGFDELLVELVEQQTVEPTAILATVGQSRQAWAAQEAQVELEARHFARCTSIETLAAIGSTTETVELIGPGSTLLRSLYLVARDVHAATAQQSRYNQRLVLQSVDERLGVLFREMSRSNEFYAKRFLPIVRQWQTLVATEIARLTQLTARIGEIINPYVVGVPLTRKQEIFVGRTDVSRQIEQLLRDITHPPLLLYGQRRMGKTSLLYNLRWMLPHTILPLFVDLQGPVAWSADHAGFLYNIAKAMTVSAGEQGVTFPGLARITLEYDPFSTFDDWLDLIQGQLAVHGRRTILLMFDEFEALAEGFLVGHLREQAILGTLRHLIQHRPNLKILLAGSHQLQEFPSWSSYLINAQTVHLSYLHTTEARQLIEAPVADFPLTYEPSAVESIIELTHGHPYLIQLLCSEVVALKNEQPYGQRYYATAAEIAQVIPTMLKMGRQFFIDIERNQVEWDAAQYLIDLARHGEILIADPFLSPNFKDAQQVARILSQLQQRELVKKQGNGYRFQVPLIRHWFAARETEG
ncbi:MAG: hypothetical protein KDE19_08295, partial [Caldilineaceae bacterium]|nr:hypothetical protein [Caldilineaceae bacterium]